MQRQTREERHEIRGRHLRTVVRACLVKDYQIIALAPHHQQKLARGHIDQRGEGLIIKAFGADHLGGEAIAAQQRCNDLRLVLLGGFRCQTAGKCLRQISLGRFAAQYAGISRDQRTARAQAVLERRGIVGLWNFNSFSGLQTPGIAVNDCEDKGFAHISDPSANTPKSSAMATRSHMASYFNVTSASCCRANVS